MITLGPAIPRHYRGNPFVAGYNPLNEPADPDPHNLVAFYSRVEKAIRAVDPEHILFIDGNTYAMDFSQFPDTPLPNAVYACHDYSFMGFPIGDAYLGTEAQKRKLRTSFERKVTSCASAGSQSGTASSAPSTHPLPTRQAPCLRRSKQAPL